MPTKMKLGTKHECSECGTKFYDLGKPKPICPSCGADLDGQKPEGSDEPAPKPAKKAKKKPAAKTQKKKPAGGDKKDKGDG